MGHLSAEQTAQAQRHLQIMTTEQFVVQSGRSTTIAEANGRLSGYLMAVSSTLVALAFIGQMDRLGSAFVLFALVIFLSVLFLGIFTFERVLQTGLEDSLYMREMQRIRHYYLEQAPELADYFLLSTHDDAAGMAADMGMLPSMCGSRAHSWLSTSAMVTVINSVLVGVFVGFLTASVIGLALLVSTVPATLVFLISLVGHHWYQTARWRSLDSRFTARFPTQARDMGIGLHHAAGRLAATQYEVNVARADSQVLKRDIQESVPSWERS